MELTQQIATLEDEVKLLKGEIKSILKELRTALLNRDNPFVLDAPPPFKPVTRSGPATSADEASEPPAQATSTEAPVTAAPADAAQEAPPAAPTPIALPARTPHAGEEPPTPPTTSHAQQATILTDEPRWSLLTIASLAAWAEDAVATLGPRRFRLVLELAGLAGLVGDDAREVLARLYDLTPAKEDTDARPLHINECLVMIRQLEAILQGEKVTKLPRRRSARHSRVR